MSPLPSHRIGVPWTTPLTAADHLQTRPPMRVTVTVEEEGQPTRTVTFPRCSRSSLDVDHGTPEPDLDRDWQPGRPETRQWEPVEAVLALIAEPDPDTGEVYTIRTAPPPGG